MLLGFLVFLGVGFKHRQYAYFALFYLIVMVLVGFPILEIFIFANSSKTYSNKCKSLAINFNFHVVHFICLVSSGLLLTTIITIICSYYLCNAKYE